jgi:hypothetical protein
MSKPNRATARTIATLGRVVALSIPHFGLFCVICLMFMSDGIFPEGTPSPVARLGALLLSVFLLPFSAVQHLAGGAQALGDWRQVVVVGNCILYGVATEILWRILRARLWRRREAAFPSCARCGYNLTGNVSGTCPECGTPIPHRGRIGRAGC